MASKSSNWVLGNPGSNVVPSSLNCRDGAVTFVAPKVTKRRWLCHREASLSHRPLRRKSAKTTGWETLPRYRTRRPPLQQNFPMPLPPHKPPLFWLISHRSFRADRTRPTLFYLLFRTASCSSFKSLKSCSKSVPPTNALFRSVIPPCRFYRGLRF